MPLQRGEVQGYDLDRMVVDFTMRDADKIIVCAISTAAMDNLEDQPRAPSRNSGSISFCACAMSSKSGFRASSSMSRPGPTGPWCCAPTIS